MNGGNVTKPEHERQPSREDTELARHMESSAPYQYAESPAHRAVGESPGRRYSGRGTPTGGASLRPNIGDLHRRVTHANRDNGGSERGIGEHYHQGQNQSPSHHHYQGRLGNKPGTAYPAGERKISAEGGTALAPATPGRSKLRGASARADETPDRSAPLPKFGDWNEKDPASADDFSYIFNKRREEKQTGGAAMVPAMPPGTPSHVSSQKQANTSQYKPLVSDEFFDVEMYDSISRKNYLHQPKKAHFSIRQSTRRAIKPIRANTRGKKTSSHWDGVAWHQGRLNE